MSELLDLSFDPYAAIAVGGTVVLAVGLVTVDPALLVSGLGLCIFGARGALSDFSLHPATIVALAVVVYLVVAYRETIPQGVLIAGTVFFTGISLAVLVLKRHS
ncbi:hypothetical protein [Haloarcula onubensis]|uniref:Uncharacterized protein n=1 Tax=Haloarcula onubensis TaxID=2950539 RepID=A0ABU2FVT1_9EURY|nr:hypothetical protein [Halomicroarcula sp. S3CR25-11]MDS0284387.1 hypothetical protein [Halomicroarcula sp. S3CR25-11]